jgi:alkylation response protein AidB-like acyl-CoA dehydrogenase
MQESRGESVARARDLAGLIAGCADTIEETRRLPRRLLGALHQARLFRMLLPRSVGGDEIAPMDYVDAIEELGRHDGSVAWCVSIANSTALIAPYLPRETADRIFGPSRAVVAWGPPNEATAQAVPGGYRISGRWGFASGCRHATWMGAHGRVIEPDGSFRLDRFGRPAVRTWLFPVSEAKRLDTWDTIGLRGTASDEYQVEDLFVAEEYSATRDDPSLRREPGRLYAFPQQTLYSVGIAGVALGIARAMLDAFVALARDKAPRGQVRLADSAVVQSEVAQAEARLGAARAYLIDSLATVYAAAGAREPIDIPARARIRLAGTHAIHSAVSVADFTYRAAGVDAIFIGSDFARRFRDIHTLTQQIQSRVGHFESIGQILLGATPEQFV